MEKIEKNMVRPGFEPTTSRSVVDTRLGKFSMNRLQMYYFFAGQKLKMDVSYDEWVLVRLLLFETYVT